MTLLIASAIADEPSELIARAEAAWAKGAEAVELRLDGLRTRSVSDRPDGDSVRTSALGGGSAAAREPREWAIQIIADYIIRNPRRQFILTCRSKAEGGQFEGTPAELLSCLSAFQTLPNALLDLEISNLESLSNLRSAEHPVHHAGRFEILNLKSQIPNLKSEISNSKSQISNLKSQISNLKSRIPNLESEISNLKSVDEAPDSGSRADRVDNDIIASAHFFDRKPAEPRAIIESTLQRASVAKVAYACEHIADSFPALDLMCEFRDRVIAIAMGEDGLWTRVLAKKLAAFATFAALEAGEATAPGQLTLDEMINLYRWRDINESTKVYGVIGDPVAHSLSPALFNHWFAEHGINAVYLPLRVRGGDEGLRRFLAECMARPWLDLGGFSVTIPHKEAALAWLGTPSDNLTRSVGALNTLCFRESKAFGYNTDCYAAVASVAAALGRTATDLAGWRVHVLGAGGAARAILEGFGEAGCHVTVFARSFAKAVRLGEQFQCDAAPWEERGREPADILINTTPVGMWPDIDQSPMDDSDSPSRPLVADGSRDQEVEGSRDQGIEGSRAQDSVGRAMPANSPPLAKGGLGGVAQSPMYDGVGRAMPADSPQSTIDNRQSTIPRDLSRYRLAFDLIYRPQQTKLLRDAKAAGCQTLNGLDMFLRQAAVQFELWTGIAPDLTSARDLLVHSPGGVAECSHG